MAKKCDYYNILGVDKNANQKEIKKAYRELYMKYHPDKTEENEKEKFTEKFREIIEAYAVLSNEKKKQRHDQFGHTGTDGFTQEEKTNNIYKYAVYALTIDNQVYYGVSMYLGKISLINRVNMWLDDSKSGHRYNQDVMEAYKRFGSYNLEVLNIVDSKAEAKRIKLNLINSEDRRLLNRWKR